MENSETKGGRTRRTTASTPAPSAKTPVAPAERVAPAGRAAAPKKASTTRRTGGVKASVAPATTVERDEMVRIAAYFRAEQRGFAPGYEVADWLAALREVAERATPATPAKSARAAARKRDGG